MYARVAGDIAPLAGARGSGGPHRGVSSERDSAEPLRTAALAVGVATVAPASAAITVAAAGFASELLDAPGAPHAAPAAHALVATIAASAAAIAAAVARFARELLGAPGAAAAAAIAASAAPERGPRD